MDEMILSEDRRKKVSRAESYRDCAETCV